MPNGCLPRLSENVYKSDERNGPPRWWLPARDFSRVRGCEENQTCCCVLFSAAGKVDVKIKSSNNKIKSKGESLFEPLWGSLKIATRTHKGLGLHVSPGEGGAGLSLGW